MDSNYIKILNYLAKLERDLIRLYGNTYKAAVEIEAVRQAINEGETFSWSGNKAASAKVDRLLKQLTNQVEVMIANGIKSSYTAGEEGSTASVIKALGKRPRTYLREAKDICDAAVESSRKHGATANARVNARKGGLDASARIWQSNAKKEIEIIIQNGIKEGKSPQEVANSIRPYLLEPNRYEKSVLNPETGKLERSDAARNYHPGQGVYRSSFKNALRMARTEMTQAYRAAEWESYQNNPLVKAYEIKLSGNHTTKKTIGGKSVVVPLEDICDELRGIYPKTFKWEGWHPQCRCYMVPVMVSNKDFKALLEARKADRESKKKGEEATAVKKMEEGNNVAMPKNFENWVSRNGDRIRASMKNGGTLPNFIKENYKDGDIDKGLAMQVLTDTQRIKAIAAARHAARTQQQIDYIKARWNARKSSDNPPAGMLTNYTSVTDVNDTFENAGFNKLWFENGNLNLSNKLTGARTNGSTDCRGTIYLTDERKKLVLSALGKIGSRNSKDITFKEADAMATFWHEITHNRHKGSSYRSSKHNTEYMELCNEYVARKTLDEFYKALGCNNPYPQFTNNRSSTGYNTMVNNFRYVVEKCNLDQTSVLNTMKKGLFEGDYDNQKSTIRQSLIDGGLKYVSGKKKGQTISFRDADILAKVIAFQNESNVNDFLIRKNVI